MNTILHLTDLHLTAGGTKPYGLDPKARFTAAIDRVVTDFPHADLLVFTGDLTDEGDEEAYDVFADLSARLPMPWIATIGNHDRRDVFLRRYPKFEANGFVQSEYRLTDLTVLMLDSKEPNTHAGSFCEERADWLREKLEASETPVLICMHHHPMALGIAELDSIGLMDDSGKRLADVLTPFKDKIVGMLHGHTHRTTFAKWNGIPVIGQRSQVHQASLGLEHKTYVEDTGAAMTLLQISGSDFMAHQVPIERPEKLSTATDRIKPVQ